MAGSQPKVSARGSADVRNKGNAKGRASARDVDAAELPGATPMETAFAIEQANPLARGAVR